MDHPFSFESPSPLSLVESRNFANSDIRFSQFSLSDPDSCSGFYSVELSSCPGSVSEWARGRRSGGESRTCGSHRGCHATAAQSASRGTPRRAPKSPRRSGRRSGQRDGERGRCLRERAGIGRCRGRRGTRRFCRRNGGRRGSAAQASQAGSPAWAESSRKCARVVHAHARPPRAIVRREARAARGADARGGSAQVPHRSDVAARDGDARRIGARQRKWTSGGAPSSTDAGSSPMQ
jgi:hypothetical protein